MLNKKISSRSSSPRLFGSKAGSLMAFSEFVKGMKLFAIHHSVRLSDVAGWSCNLVWEICDELEKCLSMEAKGATL